MGTPAWSVLDLSASWQAAARLRLVGGAGNLLDEAYRVHGSGIDGYGRHAWIGVEWGR
jgi:outer membrane receptor protein involved in Fe transport